MDGSLHKAVTDPQDNGTVYAEMMHLKELTLASCSVVSLALFQGSIFIVFNSKEDGEKFLNTETVEYSGTELKKETR